MITNKFNTIVDSAWGSSAKGAASARLADIFRVENLSSCNFPNAGHTVIYGDTKFVAKVLPSGAILRRFKPGLDPNLWVGPNSGFEVSQLHKELEQTGNPSNVYIHERAVVVESRHIEAESPGGHSSTEHISSTMSGSGAAFTEKAMRAKGVTIAAADHSRLSGVSLLCPEFFFKEVRQKLQKGTFLHEVSQGWALSINHGTHYPTCTFRDCTPQQAYADFGILPKMVGDVYLNVRSFPIRVGNNFRDGVQTGYSGDFLFDQEETTWEKIGTMAEMPAEEIAALAERERTTVTKKIRRCATPSWGLLKLSAEFCGATKLILNFPQYIHWSAHKIRGGKEQIEGLHPLVRKYIDIMEEVTNLPVVMLGTGAGHEDYVWME